MYEDRPTTATKTPAMGSAFPIGADVKQQDDTLLFQMERKYFCQDEDHSEAYIIDIVGFVMKKTFLHLHSLYFSLAIVHARHAMIISLYK